MSIDEDWLHDRIVSSLNENYAFLYEEDFIKRFPTSEIEVDIYSHGKARFTFSVRKGLLKDFAVYIFSLADYRLDHKSVDVIGKITIQYDSKVVELLDEIASLSRL